jgi:A/G-specific adenine glycosylase
MEIDREKSDWFQEKILQWGKENGESFPWRECDSSVHQLLAEILLQRTRAEQVSDVFCEFSKSHPDIESLDSLSEGEILEMIQGLGLHWRAKKIRGMISRIRNDYGGQVPMEFEELVALPGVGPYAASAFLSLHRGVRKAIIDSNVVRLYGRFFGFDYDGETRRKKWLIDIADSLTPKTRFRMYNYAIIDFARNVCRRNPLCQHCPLAARCSYNRSM